MTKQQAQRGHEASQGPKGQQAPQPPSWEILADRYDGLLAAQGDPPGKWSSKTWQRLYRVLQDLYEGTARAELHAGDGDPGGTILDDLHVLIRSHLIARIDEQGLAR